MARILNFIVFQVGWFACVLGAKYNRPYWGPAVVAVVILIRILQSRGRREEARLIALVGILGSVLETLSSAFGWIRFGPTQTVPWLCPLWVTALWMNLAATLNGSMAWLGGRPLLAAAMGAIFGPLTYLAGVRMEVIEFHPTPWLSLGVLAVGWGLLMPFLIWLAQVVNPAGRGE